MSSFREPILALVNKYQSVSFIELEQLIPGIEGGHALFEPQFPNVIYWDGLSHAACQDIISLLQEELIAIKPCNQLVYLIDGRQLPTTEIATRYYAYAKPHWLPSVLIPHPRLARQNLGATTA